MQPLPTRESFLRRFDHLLENTAHLLDVHLEVWGESNRPLASHRPPRACTECSRRAGDVYGTCQATRRARSRSSAERGESATWLCPNGMELTAQPIGAAEPALGSLLSVSGVEPGTAEPPAETTLDRVVYGSLQPDFLARPLDANGPDAAALDSPVAQPVPLRKRRAVFLSDLARLLADQLYVIHEYGQLHGELSSRYEELSMLYNLSGRITSHDDMRQGLRRMCEETRSAISADIALLAIHRHRILETLPRPGLSLTDVGGMRAWSRLTSALERRLTGGSGDSYAGALDGLVQESALLGRPVQVVAVRVVVKGQVEGAIALLRLGEHSSFRLSDLKLLHSVSEQVALAVSNSELYEDLQDFLMATVKSLVSAIEAKDPYTSGHSERVNLISMLIGKAMGLGANELETLRWASILHDVGKIGMPECILNKPDRLNVEEQRVMREHPDRGYKVLSPIRQLETPAISVRAHHEQWGGGGYPLGISGSEIPALARIISVADTFDALTTTRPYRTARTFDFAVGEILKVRGTQLDPEVVDVFVQLIPFLEEHHVMIHAAAEAARGDEAA